MARFFKDGISAKKYCEGLGLNYKTIYKHLDRGLTLDEAIERYKKFAGKLDANTKIFIKGKSLLDWCGGDKKKYQSIYGYVYRGKMTLEQAIERFC
jgi:hypothetical protein